MEHLSPQVTTRVICTSRATEPATVDDILKFRKRILVDDLGWKLEVCNGRELDAFDNDQTIYGGIYQNDQLCASFRLIRTDFPYLAEAVFPELATRKPYPHSPRVWELSRLAVQNGPEPYELLLRTYAAAFHYVEAQAGEAIVAFSEVAKERLVRMIGITTDLLGEPTQIGTDQAGRPIVCVAGLLPLAAQRGARFEKLMSYVNSMEIEHADALFGRQRVSA